MSHLTFKIITPELSRIYDDGCVGEVYRQPDILNAGRHVLLPHLNEDPRGPHPIVNRSRIREETRLRMLTHPYY